MQALRSPERPWLHHAATHGSVMQALPSRGTSRGSSVRLLVLLVVQDPASRLWLHHAATHCSVMQALPLRSPERPCLHHAAVLGSVMQSPEVTPADLSGLQTPVSPYHKRQRDTALLPRSPERPWPAFTLPNTAQPRTRRVRVSLGHVIEQERRVRDLQPRAWRASRE